MLKHKDEIQCFVEFLVITFDTLMYDYKTVKPGQGED